MGGGVWKVVRSLCWLSSVEVGEVLREGGFSFWVWEGFRLEIWEVGVLVGDVGNCLGLERE